MEENYHLIMKILENVDKPLKDDVLKIICEINLHK